MSEHDFSKQVLRMLEETIKEQQKSTAKLQDELGEVKISLMSIGADSLKSRLSSVEAEALKNSGFREKVTLTLKTIGGAISIAGGGLITWLLKEGK